MSALKKSINYWDRFFFQERPTEGIALFRIIWVGLIMVYFLMDLANTVDFYGPHGIVSMHTTRAQMPFLHMNLFNLFPNNYEATYLIVFGYGVSLLMALVGFYTRPALIVSLILMTSLHQRNIWLLSSAEVLMRTITLLLIFSPCGHSYSVDAILGKYFPSFQRKRNWPAWSWRLIQIQLSVVYLWTFWHKLQGETWIDGTAVYYATRLENLTNMSLPLLLDSMPFLRTLTWSTLMIEFALGALIWVEDLRKPLIIIGIVFHLGIELLMSIPFFELFMMALLINFFKPEEIKTWVHHWSSLIAEKLQTRAGDSAIKEKIVNVLRGVQ